MAPVKLFYLRRPDGKINFGDDLSPTLLEYVIAKEVVWAPISSCDIVGVGSILGKACKRIQIAKYTTRKILQRKKKKTIVWGSGFIKERRPVTSTHLDVRLVRGPKTSSLIKRSNIPFGDPGLLAADIVPKSIEKKYSLGIIPHFVGAKSSMVSHLQNSIKHSTDYFRRRRP